MTAADSLAAFDRALPVAAVPEALRQIESVGLDARRVSALDVVRVLPAVGALPGEAAAWRDTGRRYVVKVFDYLTASVGLRAFPAADPAPGCVFADAEGLAALRAPGGLHSAFVVAEGLPRFLRAATERRGGSGTLGVVSAEDWTPALAGRVLTRARTIAVDGSPALLANVLRDFRNVRDISTGRAAA